MLGLYLFQSGRALIGRHGHVATIAVSIAIVFFTLTATAVQAGVESRNIDDFCLGDDATVTSMIVVGDPDGSPAVTPDDRIDPNTPTSPFAGVVSINPVNTSGKSYIGSGSVISSYHILTAGHCVDTDGDGMVDLDLSQTSVVFNNNTTPQVITGVAAVDLHPDFTGFDNPSINDDIAIITLANPIPAGVPIYPISDEPFDYVQLITMVGYGTTGDGVSGFEADSSDFFVKRTGQNVASVYDLDDEGTDAKEVFRFDFDGPTEDTDFWGDGETLGNNIETTIGPGDSGGPSFIWTDDGDELLETDELTLFGINTFSVSYVNEPEAPLFGSVAGGMVVGAYSEFITGVVPEPATMGLLVMGGLAMLRRRRR